MDTGGAGASASVIITPDASVLLKWVLGGDDERDTDVALALRDEAAAGTLDLVVAQLWIYEVGNTLARRFPDEAGELLESLADSGLAEARLGARWRIRAVSLSVTYGVAFSDAAYHARGARPSGCVRHGGRTVCAPRLESRRRIVPAALANTVVVSASKY